MLRLLAYAQRQFHLSFWGAFVCVIAQVSTVGDFLTRRFKVDYAFLARHFILVGPFAKGCSLYLRKESDTLTLLNALNLISDKMMKSSGKLQLAIASLYLSPDEIRRFFLVNELEGIVSPKARLARYVANM